MKSLSGSSATGRCVHSFNFEVRGRFYDLQESSQAIGLDPHATHAGVEADVYLNRARCSCIEGGYSLGGVEGRG